MVARTDLGKNVYKAFDRTGGKGDVTGLEKYGINAYKYNSLELDFSLVGAFSDSAMFGSDYYSNLAIGIPYDGPTEGGRQIPPMEVFNYGQNGWTGDYYETTVDMRKTQDMCENIEGYSAQSLGFTLHGPDLFFLLNPVQPS